MIKIDEEFLDLVPEAFKNLSEKAYYKLTKIESFRQGFVDVGQFEVGTLNIVYYKNLPKAVGVSITGSSFYGYLRTSPIVEVLDSTDSVITFKTKGGVYKLEKVLDQ
jgi:hypothetical protein